MRISCAIVEDEPRAIEIIQRYVEKIDFLDLKIVAREPLKAIEGINDQKVQILFLDINLPEINGLQFFASLVHKPLLILTTAYPEHAVESYEIEAVDYLLKPITFERFLKSATKAHRIIKHSEASKNGQLVINVKSGGQLHRVPLNEILYFEKDGNYLIMYLKDKKIIIRENMSDIFKIVSPANFIRIHKSYVVSIQHVEMIESHQVTVAKIKIPLGASYRRNFLRAIDSEGASLI